MEREKEKYQANHTQHQKEDMREGGDGTIFLFGHTAEREGREARKSYNTIHERRMGEEEGRKEGGVRDIINKHTTTNHTSK